MVFFGVEACELCVQQAGSFQNNIVTKATTQSIYGVSKVFLLNYFIVIIEEGKLHKTIFRDKVNGTDANGAQGLLPSVILYEKFHACV